MKKQQFKNYDVFHAFLVESADYDGYIELPKIKTSDIVPKKLAPKTIIVYGSAPDSIFKEYKDMGINIIPFESEFSKSRKQVTA